MMLQLSRRNKSDTRVLLAAVLGAALLSVAWRLDARRRDRHATRLHRMLVDLLLNALSAGDPVTARHSRRVADLTDALAAAYSLDREERATLRVASLLHDMGKIDDRFFHIVHSPDPLSDAQRHEIERHPYEGAHILEPLERIHPGLVRTVESHHECWNGEGYPRGIREEHIPLAARIVSVADVFDALTQPRAYRDPLSVEEALEKIRRGMGTKFDPGVVARVERPEVLRRWMEVVRAGRAVEARKQKE